MTSERLKDTGRWLLTVAFEIGAGLMALKEAWALVAALALGGVAIQVYARLPNRKDKSRMIALVGMVVFGAAFVGCAGYYFWSAKPATMVEQSKLPDISFQKFALFWVETGPNIYSLAIVAKLFNADNSSRYVNGLTFEMSEWKMIPRGGYLIRRYAQFPDRIDFVEDNFIKPNNVGYYKKLLPVHWDMTIQGGNLPDLVIIGKWAAKIGDETTTVVPRAFGACNNALTDEQWSDLLKPKSQIDIENLNYFPVPTHLTDWNEQTVVGVSCAERPRKDYSSEPVVKAVNKAGNISDNSGIVTQGQIGDNSR